MSPSGKQYYPVQHSDRGNNYPSYAVVRNDNYEGGSRDSGKELKGESRYLQEVLSDGKVASPQKSQSRRRSSLQESRDKRSLSVDKNNESNMLQDKIVLLQQRDIKRDQENEEKQMSLKHKEIKFSHEQKQMKQ